MTATRAEILRRGLDLPNMVGVEIGPLHAPIIGKSDGPVLYVDHAATEELREKYAGAAGVNPDDIVPVDAVWGEQSLADCLGGRKVDYVIASHVAEHAPDLVTWLQEVAAVLKPSGQLRLALPDKRFSFDVLREETRITDLIAAYLVRARRPQLREVLDFRLHYAPGMDGWGVYNGTFDPATSSPAHTFELAVSAAREAMQTDRYLDVHCWVFQPRSFAASMEQLTKYDLLSLACAELVDTDMPLLEFYVFMQPCGDRDRIVASWHDVRYRLRDPLPGSAEHLKMQAEAAMRERELAAARQAAIALERELQACAQQREWLENELASAHAGIAEIQQSTSWRLTAPLRRMKALIAHRRGSGRAGLQN